MSRNITILDALRTFAAAVTAKMTQITAGEPEDQLRGPFENLMASVAAVLGWNVVCTGQTHLCDSLGCPDYAIHLNKLLAGYVELKAPGTGATASRFKGHNRDQFKRFSAIPNLLYTDGDEWALYRHGELVNKVHRLSGDVAADGSKAASTQDAQVIERIMRDFLTWQPIIPTDRKGKIDLKGFAALLAPLCRMLRDDVTEALKDASSPLVQLGKDWRHLLFPDAPDEQFADAYAQTVAFALLLGRSEGADPLTLESAETALATQHSLLSRALQILTDPGARTEMATSLDLLLRVIAVVPTATLTSPDDPWLYFYENFLAAYDPKLRKDAGAYYTPVEVVRCQVRLVGDLLVNRLNMPLGFSDPNVITLDPAAGTGTYLLGVIEHALGRIEVVQGKGAVAGQATALADNLYGFELMVGPYAVADLRVSRALRDRGATLPQGGTHVYLTDTLESPHAEPPKLPLFLRPIAEQHARALRVKSSVPVIVCLGNPPYDRHEAVNVRDEDNLSRYGGWVRFGASLLGGTIKDRNGKERRFKSAKSRLERRQRLAILSAFVEPVVTAGHGRHVKNLYNLYVYFWRWALWKVFEHEKAIGPGVVSFISASSYLDGDAFCGMREHMRRQCDEIWILDLGGEGRGTRRSDNVFAIQTPVAIALALRSKRTQEGVSARVHYARIDGTRTAKLSALEAITGFSKVKWQSCPEDWHAPFRPAGRGNYFGWPLLTDLMPWQHSGIECKRTWPIAVDEETLKRRWRALLGAEDRGVMLRETEDRTVSGTYSSSLTADGSGPPIAQLASNTPVPPIHLCGFRSFDRQRIIVDARLISRPRYDLWRVHGRKQVYATSLFNHPLGRGPALTVSSEVPDRHHLRGSYGGKDVIPLYRAADASKANILPGLLALLGNALERKISAEDFLAYVYGVLAQPAFTARFAKQLETREVRVPITKNAVLFEQVCNIGGRLLWSHTYGTRFVPNGKQCGCVPRGAARCMKTVPCEIEGYPESFDYDGSSHTLRVGDGEFAPVSREVFDFEVSGFKVVQSWLKCRMKSGAGKKSSPLDDIRPKRWTSQFTTELLELLWVLETTVASYPEQEKLLGAVASGECFQSDELPAVPEGMRKPPKPKPVDSDLFDAEM